MRGSKKDAHNPTPCTCLMQAFRTFPDEPVPSDGCASPDCLVREIDSITLHQFVSAIAERQGEGDDSGGTEDRS
jgi:hypothetical protein